MSGPRVTYQNWIVALGYDPSRRRLGFRSVPSESEKHSAEEIREAVERAVDALSEEERLLIIRYYFMGDSYGELTHMTGRAVYKLAAVHGRAVRKLRSRLAGFVRKRFGIQPVELPDCIVCQSSFRDEIDRLIAARDQGRSWKPVIKALKKRYSIAIKTPQILIGHEKYH